VPHDAWNVLGYEERRLKFGHDSEEIDEQPVPCVLMIAPAHVAETLARRATNYPAGLMHAYSEEVS
jgi:hypothetical protein